MKPLYIISGTQICPNCVVFGFITIRNISSIRWKYSHYVKIKNIKILFELVTHTISVEYLPADGHRGPPVYEQSHNGKGCGSPGIIGNVRSLRFLPSRTSSRNVRTRSSVRVRGGVDTKKTDENVREQCFCSCSPWWRPGVRKL